SASATTKFSGKVFILSSTCSGEAASRGGKQIPSISARLPASSGLAILINISPIRFLKSFRQSLYNIYTFFNSYETAVQAKMIVFGHSPVSSCIVLIIKFSFFIFFFQTFFRSFFPLSIEPEDPFFLKFQRSMDKYMKTVVPVFQHIITAPY